MDSESPDTRPATPPEKESVGFLIFIGVLLVVSGYLSYCTPTITSNPDDYKRVRAHLDPILARPDIQGYIHEPINILILDTSFTRSGKAAIHRREEDGELEIIFNPIFLHNLSDEMLDATIGHELGHVILGHLTEYGRYKGIPRLEEIYCDCWAMHVAGPKAMGEIHKEFGYPEESVAIYLKIAPQLCAINNMAPIS